MDETGSSRRRRSNSSSSTSPIAINTFSSPTFPTISQEVLLCAIRSGAGDAAAACSNSFSAAAVASPLGFFSLFSRHFSFFSFSFASNHTMHAHSYPLNEFHTLSIVPEMKDDPTEWMNCASGTLSFFLVSFNDKVQSRNFCISRVVTVVQPKIRIKASNV